MSTDAMSPRFEALRVSGECREECLTQFEGFLKDAPDEALFRMSPLQYAATQAISEPEAVDLFLRATHAGLLDFSWGVLCPACLAFLSTKGALRALNQDRWCNFCRIPVPSMVDENVEVAFTVSPSVRRIAQHDPGTAGEMDLSLFFSPSVDPADPFHAMLHQGVLASGRVAGDTRERIQPELVPGRYAMLIPESHSVLHFEVAAEVGTAAAMTEVLEGRCIPPAIEPLAAGGQLVLHNRLKGAVSWMVVPDPVPAPEDRPPDMQPPDHRQLPFLNGTRLITAQAFRELFQAESIPSEGGLELKNLTVLFTDLKSSTEMYERIGDFKAYDLVRRHFEALLRTVTGCGGAVVKTIGDAIMASFAEPVPALQAAVAMNEQIQGVGEPEDLQLKIGLHAGPCIAVELNDRLDYFGRTVNIAARVQGEAGASEIVCTESIYAAPGAAELIDAAKLARTQNAVSLKGIEGEFPVLRLR